VILIVWITCPYNSEADSNQSLILFLPSVTLSWFDKSLNSSLYLYRQSEFSGLLEYLSCSNWNQLFSNLAPKFVTPLFDPDLFTEWYWVWLTGCITWNLSITRWALGKTSSTTFVTISTLTCDSFSDPVALSGFNHVLLFMTVNDFSSSLFINVTNNCFKSLYVLSHTNLINTDIVSTSSLVFLAGEQHG